MFWWRQQIAKKLWVAFTDVQAGNLALHVGAEPAAVRHRRRLLEQRMGVRDLRFMNQTHSARVVRTDQRDPTGGSCCAPAPDADAMVSLFGTDPMAVMVADCVPVVLAGFTPDRGRVAGTAIVHAGRQGMVSGVLTAALQELRNSDAVEMTGWIGPSICGRCYEVPSQMAADVEARVPGSRCTTGKGTTGLDLAAGAAAQLTAAGVDVERVGGCTMEERRLFSYRRNQTTGRFAGLVWREQTG